MAGMIKEFREFITRGNVVDMAVGIIIGGVFGKIVTSLVNDVIMPPIGMLLANVDFRSLTWTLAEPVRDAADPAKIVTPGVSIGYGAFINTLLDFLIIAFVIFMLIRVINKLRRQPPPPVAPPPTTRECPFCLSAIPKKATKCANCTSEVQPVEA